MEIPEEILIEPQELGIKGVYVARVISKIHDASELLVLNGDRTIENDEIMADNGSDRRDVTPE
jgi:hypothetical protein